MIRPVFLQDDWLQCKGRSGRREMGGRRQPRTKIISAERYCMLIPDPQQDLEEGGSRKVLSFDHGG